ncbi:MAG: UPF0149 family protein [Gammaproteobacteria bacterium]|jgi:uncharacterized protein YgfB (UPF0149 family)|nr:UPF0149 family protein [Luminiphilus sp.]NCG05767.1 UPF0149 family protein [Gammaproteobacteria bacterium]
MLDLLGAFEDMPDWDEIADQLFNAGQTLNPSELHGVLVGLMGAGFDPDDEHHLEQTLASVEKAVGMQLQGELVDIVSRLNLATLSAIVDTDYAFHVFLPDDDDPIEQRLRSFSNWVTGFISGYTEGMTVRQAAGLAIQPEVADVLKDFASIAQVETDQVETEEAERQLEELVDYVRLATISIVQDAINQRESQS